MRHCNVKQKLVVLCCLSGLMIAGTAPSFAQGTGGIGGGGGTGTGTGTGTGGNQGAAGVIVDADGLVKMVHTAVGSGKLARQRLDAEAKKNLPGDMTSFSPVRKISLVQLEAACEEYSQKREEIPQQLQFLAGLQRIDYVFVLPDSKDLVIAGPAEGFGMDGVGRAIGASSGRPALRLDDLIVALRTLEKTGELRCSIDPKPENMARYNQYVQQRSSTSTPTTKARAQALFPELAKILGLQDVSVGGVPPDSHFAKVLVEADYRMKMISLGLEKPPVKSLRSHLSMIPAGGNSSQRWFFVPLYDSLTKTEDGLAYQLAGQRAQVVSQEETVNASGQRSNAATTRGSTEAWAKHFTEHFPALADASPGFAELQNVFDLAIVAALMKKDQLAQKVGWTMSHFLDEQRAVLAKWNVPRNVQTLANSRFAKGGRVIGLTGGGVILDTTSTLNRLPQRDDADGELKYARQKAASPDKDNAHLWWWD